MSTYIHILDSRFSKIENALSGNMVGFYPILYTAQYLFPIITMINITIANFDPFIAKISPRPAASGRFIEPAAVSP